MKIAKLAASMMVLLLISANLAFADERDDHRDGNRHEQVERGAGPHGYHKGDRLPVAEHNKRYVVRDWRSHNLRVPPRGYHWVQSGNDFLLVAVTTGVIADLVLSH